MKYRSVKMDARILRDFVREGDRTANRVRRDWWYDMIRRKK